MDKRSHYYDCEFSVNNQLFFCGLPLRLDSYSGCSHMCKYCFAQANKTFNSAVKEEYKSLSRILPADPDQFKNVLAVAERGEKRNDIRIDWLRQKVPLHWGGMSDPFQPCEEKYKISYTWLERLNWYQYPAVISTKGTRVLTSPRYMDLLKKGKYAVQITLITDDNEILRWLEPGAPSAAERMHGIATIAMAGVWVAVRIQPMLPGTSVERNLPEFIRRLSQMGAKHVLVEKFKASGNNPNTKAIFQHFPELTPIYRHPASERASHELLPPVTAQYKYLKAARQACHENGMTYGAADNELRDLGDCICCCGIDNLPGFEQYWKYQASTAAFLAKTKPDHTVTLDDLQGCWAGGEEWIDSGNVNGGIIRKTADNTEIIGHEIGHRLSDPGTSPIARAAAKVPNPEKAARLDHTSHRMPMVQAAARTLNQSGKCLQDGITRNPKNPIRKAADNSISEQQGPMRDASRSLGVPVTAKFAIDFTWNNGGPNAPDVIRSLTRCQKDGKTAYKWRDVEPELEQSHSEQVPLF